MSSIIKLPTVMNKVSALVNKVAVGEGECFDVETGGGGHVAAWFHQQRGELASSQSKLHA